MGVKVLILEANPVTRALLARTVREGFTDWLAIEQVADVDEARRAISRETDVDGVRFGLILVDLELPDAQGLRWLSELETHPARKVATALFPDSEHLFPAIRQGAEGYLLKESRFEVLVEDLQCIVRGQPPLAPAMARRMLMHFGLVPSGSGGTAKAVVDEDRQAVLEPREIEVLTHLSKGFTVKEIASLTGLPWTAVRQHVRSLFRKAAHAAPENQGAVEPTASTP